MYEQYWELKEKPFQNTPDPHFFYHSRQHEEALAKLTYAVKEGLGAGMLTGTFGCGKTVLGRVIIENLSADVYKIAYINNPQLSYVDLLRSIVRHLKRVDLPQRLSELSTDYLLELLENILTNNVRDGGETVIIVDEAHSINNESVFDGLRMLLNFQLEDRFLLTLLLFGQSELKDKIEDIKQLEQRIAVKCHIDALNREEAGEYIFHRLRMAGQERPLFTEEAIDLIHQRSGGIPRKINRLCDMSLLAGAHMEISIINRGIIEQEIKELIGE